MFISAICLMRWLKCYAKNWLFFVTILSFSAVVIIILKILLIFLMSVKLIWWINYCRVYVIFGLIKFSFVMVLMLFANAMCCFIIFIIFLSMCWNCCVRFRSIRAYWRLKLIFIAWRKIYVLSIRWFTSYITVRKLSWWLSYRRVSTKKLIFIGRSVWSK